MKYNDNPFSEIMDSDIRNANSGFIIQGVNAQGKMGKGLAKSIYDRWPNVKSEYINEYFDNNDFFHLGSFHIVNIKDNLNVVNIVSQEYYGNDGRQYVSYPAIEVALINLIRLINKNKWEKIIHVPKIGCGLAGGNWDVIKGIFKKVIPNDFKLIYWNYAP